MNGAQQGMVSVDTASLSGVQPALQALLRVHTNHWICMVIHQKVLCT
jgi:hypothetical protein